MKTKAGLFFVLSLFWSNAVLWGVEPPAPRFRTVDVDTKIEIGYGVAVADVDGDGKPDILLADKKQFAWYKNPTWEKFVLAENLTKEDNVCIAAEDIDGDGKCEIAVGAGWNPGDTVNSGAVFYLIPPKDRAQKWEPVALHHEPTVHRMKWVKNAGGKFDLVVVPLHGRGNKNGEGNGVNILAYKMPADPKQEWKTELIDDSLHMTHNLFVGQSSDSPAQTLVVGGKEGAIMCVHDRNWVVKRLWNSSEFSSKGVGEIRHFKMAGDPNMFVATIEPMHGDTVALYHARERKDHSWDRTVLDSTLVDGHALACGDLLGIGSDQIVAGWRAMNKPGVKGGIKLFTPLDKEGKEWRQTLIDDNTMACEDLTLADLNEDGKLDIVAAGRATKNVKVYFNQGVAKAE